MKRVIVIGSPGAGKSIFSRKLRDKTGLPLHYLDMIWHLPDRTNISKEEFDEKLADILIFLRQSCHRYISCWSSMEREKKYIYCPYSNIEQNPDYTMAEFTIFPAYRRKHFAIDAVEMILDKHPGKREIKYNEKNTGAKKLWNAVAAPYEPELHHLNEEETVLVFEVKDES